MLPPKFFVTNGSAPYNKQLTLSSDVTASFITVRQSLSVFGNALCQLLQTLILLSRVGRHSQNKGSIKFFDSSNTI